MIRYFIFSFFVCISPVFSLPHHVTDTLTLSTAIESCNSVDTDEIIFDSNITLDSYLPAISGSYTIDGAGHTLYGGSHYRGFVIINNSAPVIKNLTISDMVAKGGLGAVHAGGGGGGSGGGGLGAGGGICVLQGSPTVENVNFTDCVAKGGDMMIWDIPDGSYRYAYTFDTEGFKSVDLHQETILARKDVPIYPGGYDDDGNVKNYGYYHETNRHFVVSQDGTFCAGIVRQRNAPTDYNWAFENVLADRVLFVSGLDDNDTLLQRDLVSPNDRISLWSTPRGLYAISDGDKNLELFTRNETGVIDSTFEDFPVLPRSFMDHPFDTDKCYYTTVESGTLSLYELSKDGAIGDASTFLADYYIGDNCYPCTLSPQHYAISPDGRYLYILCFSCNAGIETYGFEYAHVEQNSRFMITQLTLYGFAGLDAIIGGKVVVYDTVAQAFMADSYTVAQDFPSAIALAHNDSSRVYVLCNKGIDSTGMLHIVDRTADGVQLKKRHELVSTVLGEMVKAVVGGGTGFMVSQDDEHLYFVNFSAYFGSRYVIEGGFQDNFLGGLTKWKIEDGGDTCRLVFASRLSDYSRGFDTVYLDVQVLSGFWNGTDTDSGEPIDALYVNTSWYCTSRHMVRPGVRIITSTGLDAITPLQPEVAVSDVIGTGVNVASCHTHPGIWRIISERLYFRDEVPFAPPP